MGSVFGSTWLSESERNRSKRDEGDKFMRCLASAYKIVVEHQSEIREYENFTHNVSSSDTKKVLKELEYLFPNLRTTYNIQILPFDTPGPGSGSGTDTISFTKKIYQTVKVIG